MHEGTVKWFDEQRGFGFIAIDGHDDLFVHRFAVKNASTLGKGDFVVFDVTEDRKRAGQVRANNVEIVRKALA